MSRIWQVFLSIGTLSLLLSSCSAKTQEEQPEQQYYKRAVAALERKNYELAINNFEQLERRYPFGHYAEQAQAELVFAYFKFGDYPASRKAAERFIELHPNHPNTDYAYYMKSVAAYPGITRGLGGIFKPKSLRRDVESARQSFFEMREFVQRYPDSSYAADGHQRLIYLRNLLAANEIYVADFYLRRRAHVAALRRANNVLREFSSTPSVSDALAISVAAYRRLQLPEEAQAALATLRINYPHHPALNANGDFVDISGPSETWVDKITFGFLSKNVGVSPPIELDITQGQAPLPPPSWAQTPSTSTRSPTEQPNSTEDTAPLPPPTSPPTN